MAPEGIMGSKRAQSSMPWSISRDDRIAVWYIAGVLFDDCTLNAERLQLMNVTQRVDRLGNWVLC
jgi:hypothetical protein